MKLNPYLVLLRPPNVFTSMADAAAGLAIARGGMFGLADPGMWCLVSSALLYLGGMALNDFFDREIDAVERPSRPIPSGAIKPATAATLGFGLLGAGVVAASFAGGGALAIAILLAAAILSYDAMLKDSPIGFLNMGVCRGLNILMPMMLARDAPIDWAAPIILTMYVTAITYLSKDEVAGGSIDRARNAVVAMTIVAGVLLGTAAARETASPLAWGFIAVVLVRGFSVFAPVWEDASGPTVGRAIGGAILTIPLLDAAVVAAAGHEGAAFVVAAFAIPAFALRPYFSPT